MLVIPANLVLQIYNVLDESAVNELESAAASQMQGTPPPPNA